jgi:hypothetical protein
MAGQNERIEHMALNWQAIRSTMGGDRFVQEVREQVIREIKETGTVDLEDVLLHRTDAGDSVFTAIGKIVANPSMFGLHAPPMFRFQCTSLDYAGTQPKPGAVYTLSLGMKTEFYSREGRLVWMNTQRYNEMRNLFRVHKRPEDNPDNVMEYVLDDECCFVAGFGEAVELLANYSPHSGRDRETVAYKRDIQGNDTDVVLSRTVHWQVMPVPMRAAEAPKAVASGGRGR